MGRVSWRPASALPYVDCALTTYPSKLTPFETSKDRRMLSVTLTSLSTGVEKSGSKYILCADSVLSKFHSLDRRVLPHSQLVRCVNYSSTFGSWWRNDIPMDTARTPRTTCHGKVSRRSVFSGLLSQLFFTHISLAYALVRLFLVHWKGYRFENNVSGLPDSPVQRSLTLIAKVIQSLANLNTVSSMSFVNRIFSDQNLDRWSIKKSSCVGSSPS
jgi:hypothetical protein